MSIFVYFLLIYLFYFFFLFWHTVDFFHQQRRDAECERVAAALAASERALLAEQAAHSDVAAALHEARTTAERAQAERAEWEARYDKVRHMTRRDAQFKSRNSNTVSWKIFLICVLFSHPRL